MLKLCDFIEWKKRRRSHAHLEASCRAPEVICGSLICLKGPSFLLGRAHAAADANQPHGGVGGEVRQGGNESFEVVADDAKPGEVQQLRDVAVVAELKDG